MNSVNISDDSDPTVFAAKANATQSLAATSGDAADAGGARQGQGGTLAGREEIPRPGLYTAFVAADHGDALSAVADVYSDNPGLALAAPVFDLLLQAKRQLKVDATALHQQLATILRSYESQVAEKGVSATRARLLLYGLAATVDDVVLRTSWGAESAWSHKSMISLFFRETWGGERFYALLNQMMATASSFAKEIELYYYCLQFGFEGRYRLQPQGDRQLSRIREELHQFVKEMRGSVATELSPAWRGVAVAPNRMRGSLRYWLAALGAVLVLLAIFATLTALLRRETTNVVWEVEDVLQDPATALREVQTIQPLKPPPRVVTTDAPPPEKPFDAISAALAPWQQQGFLAVTLKDGKTVIRTTKELFASAATTLRAPYPAVLRDVAATLQKFPGAIEVVGYSDNVPIKTATYPDNLALSRARAMAVADLIAGGLKDPARVTSKGMGAADPVAPNTTAAGRLANRRAEIVLTSP